MAAYFNFNKGKDSPTAKKEWYLGYHLPEREYTPDDVDAQIDDCLSALVAPPATTDPEVSEQ